MELSLQKLLSRNLSKSSFSNLLSLSIQLLQATIFLLLSIIFLTPFYWMFTGSFKEMTSALSVPPEFVPKNPTLSNYYLLFIENPALLWVFNSLIVSSVGAVLGILATSLPGYVFSKKRFPGRTVLFTLVLLTMLTPDAATIVPKFIILKRLSLLNNYVGVFIPWIVWPFGVFLMKQYIDTIPSELLDAARIDGASEIGLYWRIILPLSGPIATTIGIFFFMSIWNDYLWQYLILSEPQVMTLPVGLISLLQNTRGFIVNFGVLMAGSFISVLPLFILFIVFQDQFMRGLTSGALKG